METPDSNHVHRMENGSSCVASRSPKTSELIILGSGSSTGVPSPKCLIRPVEPPCAVCHSAMEGKPEFNKNYRCNPSLLINYLREDGERQYIQIDAGKNFKEQVLRWFVRYKIPRLDALILTHEHADAVLGLDDIRGVQDSSSSNDIEPLPIFLSQTTMNSLRDRFPYLVKTVKPEGTEFRRVAQLEYQVIDTSSATEFDVNGLNVKPLPVLISECIGQMRKAIKHEELLVMHGEDYVCLGFLFGRQCRVAYISDVSRIPAPTEQEISREGAGSVDILILDCLAKSGPHNTHFCWEESLATVKKLRPKRAFFVGMTHDFDHERENAELVIWSKREGIEVQLAHDGLRIPVEI